MLAIRFRWKGKCPRHPNYNPAKSGECAIKGECSTCHLLFEVYRVQLNVLRAAAAFDEIDRARLTAVGNIRIAAARAFEKAS